MEQSLLGMRSLLDSVSQKLHPVYDQLKEFFRQGDDGAEDEASPCRSATFLRHPPAAHHPPPTSTQRMSWPASIINKLYSRDNDTSPARSEAVSPSEQRCQGRLSIRDNTPREEQAPRGKRLEALGDVRWSQSMPRPSFLAANKEQQSLSAGCSPVSAPRQPYVGEEESGEMGKTSPRDNIGRIQFSLTYDFHDTALYLKIIRAEDLVAKDYSGTSDPYVRILMLPDKKSEIQTSIKRKNLNPKWNETFTFEGYPYNKLLTKTLCLQVFDYDRFSRDDPIGEVFLPLSDLDFSATLVLWKSLQPPKTEGKTGELQCSLRYMPSSCKIHVGIIEARYLRPKDITGYSDPYVKIWLLNDSKRVEKRRTKVINKELNPHFNETFEFEVPYERIRQTSLLVSVHDHDYLSKNEVIGSLLLGPKSGSLEQKHWNEMFSRSRQSVVYWHQLKNLTVSIDP